MKDDDGKQKKRGPKEERLIIEGDPEEALKKLLRKPPGKPTADKVEPDTV